MSKKEKISKGEWIMIITAIIATIVFAIGILITILRWVKLA